MEFKDGVDPRYLSAPAWHGVYLCDRRHKIRTKRDLVVTSTGEGKHTAKRSRHYTGDYGFGHGHAFDVRVWYLFTGVDLGDPSELELQGWILACRTFVEQLQADLGKDYVVLLELNARGRPSHIHIHWAPVYQESSTDV